MALVTIYTGDFCGYCKAAKSLLTSRGIEFEEIKLGFGQNPDRQELTQRTGMKTVPQIFFQDQLIGGYDQLAEIDQKDQLASLKRSP